MRALILLVLLMATPALAQPRAGAAPRQLGVFQNWTAATFTDGGQKVCYAFTRATRNEGGGQRGTQNVQLLVTHRPGARDAVAVRVGYNFGRGAEMRLLIGQNDLPGYTNQDSGFIRDGRAAVAAMRGGREAMARAPGPNNRGVVTNVFSLAGFSAAYDAMSRECPTTPARR